MLHVRPRGQVTTVSSSQEGSPTSPKRERFLKRVVDQIEVDRLNRRLRSYLTTKYAAEASERYSLSKSMPGDVTDRGSDAVRSNDVISSSDALKSSSDDSDCNLDNKKRGSKLSLSLPPRSKQSFSPRPLGLNSHKRAESLSYATHTRLHKDKLKNFSKSQKDSSDSESQNSQRSDVSKASLPSSRQVPLASSGPYYGHNKPPTPQKPPPRPNTPKATEPTEKNMFSWKICTPTNWKRGKSYHEILLEKKCLRRTGRLPSQSRFVSIFKPKDSRKPTAADRIRGVLKRAQFHGDDIKRLPLVRFRRAARTLVALLKTVKISKKKEKGMESALWFDDDEVRASKRAYEMFGVSFDAFAYRARREIQVSNEAKAILTMAPGTRSDEQRHVALVSLSQAVPEFGEFPRAMQEALVRVGWYECFEARRIIIREGHMADNFYLILSGSAVVTIRDQNAAGDYFGRTAAVLQRGNSFGELALIYGGKRSATVTCKDNVELLAVGRDDYIDIFMHKTRDGDEPEHIKFLKQIRVFCGWPIHSLPLDDPSVFLYTYVRRGVVLCKDSNKSEWIYVIKSGSCRVLTALTAVKPSIQGADHTKDVPGASSKHADDRHHVGSPPHSTPRLPPLRSRDGANGPQTCGRHGLSRTTRLPSIKSRSDHEVQVAATLHLRELDDILKKQNTEPAMVTELPNGGKEDTRQGDPSKHKTKNERIFVNLLTLAAKDVYGLEPVVLSVFKQPTRTSLVSDGAECIMINKKFFTQKLTEDVVKKIRAEIRPLPSEEVLQEKLQTQKDWDTYRAITVADFVDFRKQLQDFHLV